VFTWRNFAGDRNLKYLRHFNTPQLRSEFTSKKYKLIAEIKNGSTVTIANDPSNLARALGIFRL